MELQDILYLVIFLAVTALSGRRKPAQNDQNSEQAVEKVRRKIQTLKKARSPQPAKDQNTLASMLPHESVHRSFSAYKHLPVTSKEALETIEVPVNVSLPIQSYKRMPTKVGMPRFSLRTWIVGQVILDRPAFQKDFYGDFMDR